VVSVHQEVNMEGPVEEGVDGTRQEARMVKHLDLQQEGFRNPERQNGSGVIQVITRLSLPFRFKHNKLAPERQVHRGRGPPVSRRRAQGNPHPQVGKDDVSPWLRSFVLLLLCISIPHHLVC
jgi:hypothetical protein